ncbi:MAG: hypothetical protein M0P31_13655 [Solirubrobacteraceae bacterium]|nr:hypothetical protein [Solirubrobacteraceae bacterium]
MPPITLPPGLPIGSVTTSGQDVTVSQLLKSSRIIERRIDEAIQPRYWADRILPAAGRTDNGFAIFEEWTPEILGLNRLEEELEPDTEVPLAGITVGELRAIEATEHGIGYVVERKHERRNSRLIIDRREKAMAYTLAEGQNRRAVAAVNAAITTHSRTHSGPDWSAIVTDGAAPTAKENWPHSTIAYVKALQQKDGAPFVYDVLLVDPLEKWRLATIYDTDGDDLARRLGVEEVIEDTTGGIAHGQPTLIASEGAGGTVEEEATRIEIIDEPRRRRKVVQATGSRLFYVDNPYGVIRITGTAVTDLTP